MRKAELVFIPSTLRGHIAPALELVKLLLARDDRLSITIIIIKLPNLAAYADFLVASNSSIFPRRIKFVDISQDITVPVVAETNPILFMNHFLENLKPSVRNAVTKIFQPVASIAAADDAPRLAGFVIDITCRTMMALAEEFEVPAYVFLPSSGAFLCVRSYLQHLSLEQKISLSESYNNDSNVAELNIPCFVKPVPVNVLPSMFFPKEPISFQLPKNKGIIVNTCMELETHALGSLICDDNSQPVYAVGPMLNLTGDGNQAFSGGTGSKNEEELIIKWLDDQPPLSVIFLCFGSMGSFCEDQLKEIASALERTGFPFLWCLRYSSSNDKLVFVSDFIDPKQVLPEGFLERTAELGRVISWAPQVAVLSNPAIGGFVSHCGWNSVLETLWFGVPLATWPLLAEQQLNAFEMVRELGLAVEIKLDYRKSGLHNDKKEQEVVLVSAQEIEVAIRRVMEPESDIRKRVWEMSERTRKAVMEGGSSHSSLDRFINNVFD